MNGNSMAGGVGGFMTGWRFGREMVEGTEADRQARAQALAAQEEAIAKRAAEERKITLEGIKLSRKDTIAQRTKEQTDAWHATLDENADASRTLQQERLNAENTRYQEGAPLRQQQLEFAKLRQQEAALKAEKQKDDAAYREAASQELKDFDQWRTGDPALDPARARSWDTLANIVVQDPKPALAALQQILPQSAELYKAGNLKGISELWASPAGKTAMQAWAPAYRTAIGKPVEGGNYVIQDINPNRLEMAGDGVAMILDVGIAPSPAFAEQLTRQRAQATTPEAIARIDRQLAPSTYQAPLTEGRVPVGEGGQARIFTQAEFAAGVSNLQQRLAFHEQHPEEVAKVRRRMQAAASGAGRSEGMKAKVALDNTLIQEQLRQQDQVLRQEGLAQRQAGTAGRDKGTELNRKFAAVDKATGLAIRDTFKDDARQSVSREVMDYQQALNLRAKDLLTRQPGLGLEEAFQQAEALTPLPESEIDKKMAGLRGRLPAKPEPSATGHIDGARQQNPVTGEVVVLRNGQWVKQ